MSLSYSQNTNPTGHVTVLPYVDVDFNDPGPTMSGWTWWDLVPGQPVVLFDGGGARGEGRALERRSFHRQHGWLWRCEVDPETVEGFDP